MTNEELSQHFGRGWWSIARTALELLDREEFELLQIKEKFGYLRIYYKAPDSATKEAKKRVREGINLAETKSTVTCENCGKAGGHKLVHDCWWKTLCKDCKEVSH